MGLPPRQPRVRIRWMRVRRRRRFFQTRRKPRPARTTRAFRSLSSRLWPAGGSWLLGFGGMGVDSPRPSTTKRSVPGEGSWWNGLQTPHEVVSRRQQQKERDGNNWPGQPHQEKHPTQYKEAMELIRHKGGEERASGRGNRWGESWWQKTAKLKHKKQKAFEKHYVWTV